MPKRARSDRISALVSVLIGSTPASSTAWAAACSRRAVWKREASRSASTPFSGACAVLVAAAARGGLEPDLPDEVIWWHGDDFWRYGLAAAVALIRSCADRMGVAVPEFAQQLADRKGITL